MGARGKPSRVPSTIKAEVRDECALLGEDIHVSRRERIQRTALRYCSLTEQDQESECLKRIGQCLFSRETSGTERTVAPLPPREQMANDLRELLSLAQ